jgi:hypothetical protein
MPAIRTAMIDEGSAQPRRNRRNIVRRLSLQVRGRCKTTEMSRRQTASSFARTAVLNRQRTVRIPVAEICNATQTCRVIRQVWWWSNAFSVRTTQSE